MKEVWEIKYILKVNRKGRCVSQEIKGIKGKVSKKSNSWNQLIALKKITFLSVGFSRKCVNCTQNA